MHEYQVTLEIIRIAEKHASEHNAAAVKQINLVVGEESGYVGDSVRLYFDLIAEGTLCEDAELVIETVKPKLRCEACGKLFERKPFSFTCPGCGGGARPTEIGREFFVKSVEV